jgi:bis(5'-nucleosyl)-tetraphosphatase (symmetrical)
MATYAIGDIQGCFKVFEKLLEQIKFNEHQDVLWCAGDLVNRGPQSLEALRYFKSLGGQHQVVLGNHDLHLIAVAYGARAVHKTDTLQAILDAPDRDALIDWLCHRPILVHDASMGYVMTHAGIAPMWDLLQAKSIASEIEITLQGGLRESFLKNMFGNQPDYWRDDLTGMERLRCAINYFTRMRYCYPDGRLELTYKGAIKNKPSELIPWFDVRPRKNTDVKIVFGHWAALGGQADVPNVYPLDTGCVWGNCLTAMRLEDQKIFSVECG